MKTQRNLLSLLLVILCLQLGFSQEFQVPKDLNFESPEDFKKIEPQVVNCIDWLALTPVNEQVEKRKEANAFLMKWASETRSLTIEIRPFQLELTQKNSPLLTAFIGGWVKHVIQHPSDNKNKVATNVAGLQNLMNVYTLNKGNGLKKDRKIEKLKRMDANELQAWVQEQLK